MKSFLRKLPGFSVETIGLLLTLAATAGADEKILPPGEKTMFVKVTAVVVKYEPDALRDTFEDGAFAVYDATELRIVSPEKYVGKLVVFHNQPPDDKSPWKAIGATIGFRLKADLLESKDTQVFSGAMEAIQMIKKPGEGRRVRRQPPTAAALQRREAPSAVGRERATREPKTS